MMSILDTVVSTIEGHGEVTGTIGDTESSHPIQTQYSKSIGTKGDMRVLRTIGRILDHQMKVSEYLGTLILIGIPYGIVGVVWTVTHTSHLSAMNNLWDEAISFLGSIVCWPVLIFANVTMT